MAAPVFSIAAPPVGSIGAHQRVAFSVTSAPALARVMVFVRFPGAGFMEVVWDGSAFASAFARNATRTAIAGGFTFEFIREPIWPDSFTVDVYAINTGAEEATTSFSWTLSELDAAGIGDAGTLPVFPISAPVAGADSGAVAHDQAYYLAVGEKLVDPEYIAGMKNGSGAGYELFQAAAKVMERASLSVQRAEIGSLMLYAQGGARATGTVELYRETALHGAVAVKAGSIVAAGSRLFFSLDDCVFGINDLGPVITRISSVFQGYAYNVPGRTITPSGYTIYGDIDTPRQLVEDPPYGDPTIKVRQINPTLGGRDPDLDILGLERGLARRNTETDDHYRLRMRSLADNITPAAVKRLARNYLSKYRVGFEFIETTDPSYCGSYDTPRTSPNVFVYDDPRPTTPFRNRWVDEIEQFHTFIIVAGKIQCIADVGGMYDDANLGAADVGSPLSGGRRCVTAFDHDRSDAGVIASHYLTDCYDGRDYELDSVYAGLWKQLQDIKAGGISAILERAGS